MLNWIVWHVTVCKQKKYTYTKLNCLKLLSKLLNSALIHPKPSTICPYQPLHLVNSSDRIQCLHGGGWSTLGCPCIGVSRRMLLMSLSLVSNLSCLSYLDGLWDER